MIDRPRALAFALLVVAWTGCSVDLFHGTDWSSRCDLDPKDPLCTHASGTGGAGGSGGIASGPGSSSSGAMGGASSSISTSSSGAGASAGGAGGTSPIGCADGMREGFLDQGSYPLIAACAGAWSLPGVGPSVAPACGHDGGDDGPNPNGLGCTAADLCASGWHICQSAAEVAQKSPTGCTGSVDTTLAASFFATSQSGPGANQCGAGTNDLFGCGTLGVAADPTTCAPLDRASSDLCAALAAPWSCGTDGTLERDQVTKTASNAGGVLCCHD